MFEEFEIIDLTHKIRSDMPTWSGCCGFNYEVKRDYDTGIRILKYKMHGSCGTHIDAPSHFFQGGLNVADLSLSDLVVPFALINVSERCSADLTITKKDILDYEKEYGELKANTFVIGFTGWSKYWSDGEKYRNEQLDGSLLFPTFSLSAVEYLLGKKISGIGIDTLSPDPFYGNHPVHHRVLGAGKYIVENIAYLEKLISRSGVVIILPLKIEVGTEASIRMIALVRK